MAFGLLKIAACVVPRFGAAIAFRLLAGAAFLRGISLGLVVCGLCKINVAFGVCDLGALCSACLVRLDDGNRFRLHRLGIARTARNDNVPGCANKDQRQPEGRRDLCFLEARPDHVAGCDCTDEGGNRVDMGDCEGCAVPDVVKNNAGSNSGKEQAQR